MRPSEGTRFLLRIQFEERWGFEHTTWAERGPRGANDGENKPPEVKQASCSDAASNDNLEPTVGKSLETLPREAVQKPPRQKNVPRQDVFEFRSAGIRNILTGALARNTWHVPCGPHATATCQQNVTETSIAAPQ